MRLGVQKFFLMAIVVGGSALNLGCSSGFTVLNSQAPLSPQEQDVSTVQPPVMQPDTQRGPVVTLSNENSITLYNALVAAGLRDNSGRYGATTLEAADIDCTTATASGAVAACKIYSAGNTLNMTPEDSVKVNAVFTISAVKGEDGRGTTYSAYNIYCNKVVYPGATPTCMMSKDPEVAPKIL